MKNKTQIEEALKNGLKEINSDLDLYNDLNDFLSLDDIIDNDIDSIIESLRDDSSFFNIEITYYYEAIEYLKNNDSSLRESLEIANEYGYSLDSLSSEILASLLASQKESEKEFELRSRLESLIDELTVLIESEEN